MTRVALTQYAWTEAQVIEFIDVAFRVAAHNRNRRGVCQRVACVTDDINVAYEYPVKKSKTDSTNYGTCFYCSHWNPAAGELVRYAVIHLMKNRGDAAVTTLTHEVAHALTQGAHGYTWRRMFALLLPLAWKIFEYPLDSSDHMWMRIRNAVFNAVKRYGVRYEDGWSSSDYDAAYVSRVDKLNAETEKHVNAARRYFKIFGE